MIMIDDIRKIVKLVLLSGYLKNNKPLSLLLVGKSGTGKTETICSYKTKRSVILTDANYSGLLNFLKESKKIKHIILPDFLKITMKKRATSDNFISLLNALTDEGIAILKGYFNFDFSLHNKPRTLGIVTATTKDSFSQKRKEWGNIGFLSRMIICSYDYSEITINKIIDYINSEKFTKEKSFEYITKYKDNIEITSIKELNEKLNPYAKRNFRTQKQLQTLAKCNALLRNSKVVEDKDIDEIIRLSQYLNLDYKQI